MDRLNLLIPDFLKARSHLGKRSHNNLKYPQAATLSFIIERLVYVPWVAPEVAGGSVSSVAGWPTKYCC